MAARLFINRILCVVRTSEREAHVMHSNSWLYELYTLQAKMQFCNGLAIGQPGMECSEALMAMCASSGPHDLSPEERLRYYAQAVSPSNCSNSNGAMMMQPQSEPTNGVDNEDQKPSVHLSPPSNAGFTPPASHHSLSGCNSPNGYAPSSQNSSTPTTVQSSSQPYSHHMTSHVNTATSEPAVTNTSAAMTAAGVAANLTPITPLQLNSHHHQSATHRPVLPYSPAAGCLPCHPYGGGFICPPDSVCLTSNTASTNSPTTAAAQYHRVLSSPAGAVTPGQAHTRLSALHSPPSGSLAATPPATPPDSSHHQHSHHHHQVAGVRSTTLPTKRTLQPCNMTSNGSVEDASDQSNGSHSPEAKRVFLGQGMHSPPTITNSQSSTTSSSSASTAASNHSVAAYYSGQYGTQYGHQQPVSPAAHQPYATAAAYGANQRCWPTLSDLMPMSAYYQHAQQLSASPMLHPSASTTAAVAAAAAAAAVVVANSTGNSNVPMNNGHFFPASHYQPTQQHPGMSHPMQAISSNHSPSSASPSHQHQHSPAMATTGGHNAQPLSASADKSANHAHNPGTMLAAQHYSAAQTVNHHHYHHHASFKLNYHLHSAWQNRLKPDQMGSDVTPTHHPLGAPNSAVVRYSA